MPLDATLSPRMFRRFCDLVYEKAGIALGPQKEALVSARIGKRMRSLGIKRFEDYYQHVEADQRGDELVELLNAISTNVTSFFREDRHFVLMKQHLSAMERRGQTRYRIWCAAASTGEEPYTLAMTLKESLRDTRDVKILATDISTRALNAAKAGVYDSRHMEKVPDNLARRYFEKKRNNTVTKAGETTAYSYHVANDLKRMITFARLNLAKPPFPMSGPFDYVFCRNVMIYFDNTVRSALLAEAYRLLRPGGYLMVGHAESLSGMLSNFKSVEPSVYIKS